LGKGAWSRRRQLESSQSADDQSRFADPSAADHGHPLINTALANRTLPTAMLVAGNPVGSEDHAPGRIPWGDSSPHVPGRPRSRDWTNNFPFRPPAERTPEEVVLQASEKAFTLKWSSRSKAFEKQHLRPRPTRTSDISVKIRRSRHRACSRHFLGTAFYSVHRTSRRRPGPADGRPALIRGVRSADAKTWSGDGTEQEPS